MIALSEAARFVTSPSLAHPLPMIKALLTETLFKATKLWKQKWDIQGRGFPYEGNPVLFEHVYPSFDTDVGEKTWALRMGPNTAWVDLKISLIHLFKMVGKYNTNNFRYPSAAGGSGGNDPMDVDSAGEQWPAPIYITFNRRDRTNLPTSYLQKLSPTINGYLIDVILPAYFTYCCKLCRVREQEYCFPDLAAWFNQCKSCPPEAEHDPQLRCRKCILLIRSRYVSHGFETHPEDKFKFDPSRVNASGRTEIRLSDFVSDLIHQVSAELFCVANTNTLVALYKEWVTHLIGGENLEVCAKGLYNVSFCLHSHSSTVPFPSPSLFNTIPLSLSHSELMIPADRASSIPPRLR